MQRPTYSVPAHSPPLHHPVPQHISQVPNMRSPPPPTSQSAGLQQGQNYGYGGTGFTGAPFVGNFINENTASMGVKMAEQYVDQQFTKYVNVSALKKLFDVTNKYVFNKLIIVLVPWRHKPWARKTVQAFGSDAVTYESPRNDINSPDMYIPVMGCVSYVLLSTLLAGLKGQFNPALLSSIFIWAFVVIALEIVVIRLAIYFLNITSDQSSLLDLLSYAGYKFVGINCCVLLSEIWNRGGGTGGWFGNTIFFYTYMANAFFLLRSLRYVLLPDAPVNGPSAVAYTPGRSERSQKQSRTYFLAGYSYIAQLFFMWVLTRNI